VDAHQDAFSDLPVDAYDMICQFSHSEALNNNADDYKIRKEKVDMRSAVDDMIMKGKIQGMVRMCQEFGASMEVALQQIMKECSLPEDTAMEYIKKYWVQNQ